MGRHETTKLDAWRLMRGRRQARAEAQALQRDTPPRPHTFARTTRTELLEDLAPAIVAPVRPIVKHVTQNLHRAGSVAYAMLGLGYWLPGSKESK